LSQLDCPHMPLRWINQTLMPPVGRRNRGEAPATFASSAPKRTGYYHHRRQWRLAGRLARRRNSSVPRRKGFAIQAGWRVPGIMRAPGKFPAGLALHEMMSHRVPRPPLVSTHAYFFAPGGSKAPLLKMSEDLECADSSSFLKKFSAVNRSSPAEQAS
jgi:hypothetical protein